MSLRRREFIAGLGGAAAGPLAARAQQGQPDLLSSFRANESNDPGTRVLLGYQWRRAERAEVAAVNPGRGHPAKVVPPIPREA